MKKRLLFLLFFALSIKLFAVQKIHFSVDDAINCFENLTRNEKKYDSAFEEPFFAWIKSLHEKYDAKVSLYCFYEKEGFSLADCTELFADDFKASSGWLKFGFHAEKAIKEAKEKEERMGKTEKASRDQKKIMEPMVVQIKQQDAEERN